MRPVKLRFTAEAREHIAAIYSYIQGRNSIAATQVVGRIRLAAEQLAEFPRMVLVLGVFHAAQDRERE